MRRLGMKNKRRKTSETTSSSESEENGGTRAAASDGNSDTLGKNNESMESVGTPSLRKSASKRRSRSSLAQKAYADDNVTDKDESLVESDERENGGVAAAAAKPAVNKRRKKEDQRASTSIHDKAIVDKQFEVEKLVRQRTVKGRRQFLVRWKGYGESADTWENEKDLNCPKLIDEFMLEEHESKVTKKTKASKTNKSKKHKNARKKQDSDDQGKKDDGPTDKESLKEFEVEKIIEVYFKKNGSKEFLIRWKGFSASDDTWEPEKNLNCPELIAKFMQKLEKVKSADFRELRSNPVHTKRYTLTTHESGRRLSRRNIDKQRATYHQCDE